MVQDINTNKIIEFDKSNPIVILRFLKIFGNFRKYKNPYRKNMFKVLNTLMKIFFVKHERSY